MSTSAERLTPKMLECLRVLKRVEDANDVSPTAREVSRLAGRPCAWSYPYLCHLSAIGLAGRNRLERWVLTDAGRAAIKEKPLA